VRFSTLQQNNLDAFCAPHGVFDEPPLDHVQSASISAMPWRWRKRRVQTETAAAYISGGDILAKNTFLIAMMRMTIMTENGPYHGPASVCGTDTTPVSEMEIPGSCCY